MRISAHLVMLQIAKLKASRALCGRRQVGCVLVDFTGNIISTGYNGRARGEPNCSGGFACGPVCEGVHAEINALVQAKGFAAVYAAYVTTLPCWHCAKALAASGCRKIYTVEEDCPAEEQVRGALYWLRLNNKELHYINALTDATTPLRLAELLAHAKRRQIPNV